MGAKRRKTVWDMPRRRDSLYGLEHLYFMNNPNVAGMAADDGSVVLNPYIAMPIQQERSVYENELARLFMRETGVPPVEITPEQNAFLDGNTYRNANPDDRRATILARILAGDPSSGRPTQNQLEAVEEMRRRMTEHWLKNGRRAR